MKKDLVEIKIDDFEIKINDSVKVPHYLTRPRINRALEKASRYGLVFVIAEAGYGKTMAVHHYTEQQPDAVVRWVQFSESDNSGAHFWENFVQSISFDDPGLAAKLRELGFPETPARFEQMASIVRDIRLKTFLVFDDFHLIHSGQVLTFIERCARLQLPGVCIFILSRKEPGIDTSSLLSKKKAGVITEDELRFTGNEISAYLKLRGFPSSNRRLPELIDATRGQALAVQLLALVYERIPKDLDLALRIMKQNTLNTDAMRFYGKTRQFVRMLGALFSYPLKLPHDTCEYFLNILETLDFDEEKGADAGAIFLKSFFTPLLLVGMGKYEDARKRTLDVIRKWEQSDTPLAVRLLYSGYSNLAYIDMYTCTATHEYNSPEYLKKSAEYFKLYPKPPTHAGPFAVADIRSFACLVGEGAKPGEFDQFLEAANQTVQYTAETCCGMYYGYDDLVACELAFFRNKTGLARTYACQAISKAREKKQYSIEAMAIQYILRISMHEGDYSLVKETLKQLRGHLGNPDFWNRQLMYDLYTGFFYSQIGLPQMAPSRLNGDTEKGNSFVHIPIMELLVRVNSLIADRKYNQALTVLSASYPREPQERFLFGELTFSLLQAVARFRTGDIAGAVMDFEKAYSLSFDGEFETPFVELGRNLQLLVSAALKKDECPIPEKWLNMVNYKSSVYAKKTDFIADNFKEDQGIEHNVRLTEREREALNDLYHGLTREEIAVNRHLSINTVKKTLQSLYLKLDASNSVNAIRIAIKKKLID